MPNMRWVSVLRGAIVVALMLAASSCQLDRSGLGGGRSNNVKFAVNPEIACPGETIGARWDMTNLPRVPENCRRCTTSAGCAEGFGCLDGVCCRNAELAGGADCNVGGLCLPSAISMTLSASDPAVAVPAPPRPIPLRGGVSLPVNMTMDVIAGGSFALPLELIGDRARVRVPTALDNRLPLRFEFACRGTDPAWTSYDFATLGPSTSEFVRIEGIRNTGRIAIQLTGGIPRRDAVRIEPGDTTTAFNGSPARGLWLAFIPVDARLAFPPPHCGPVETGTRLPDINVELRLACRR